MSEFNLDRFRRICGMLGSAHDGERANAATLATDMLRQAGMTWNDVHVGRLNTYTQPPQPQQTQYSYNPPRQPLWWQEMANEVLNEYMLGSAKLSDRQIQFIQTMTRHRTPPTDRQADWLEDLHAMFCGEKGFP